MSDPVRDSYVPLGDDNTGAVLPVTESFQKIIAPSSSARGYLSGDLRVLLQEVHHSQSTVLETISEANWRFDDAEDTFSLAQEAQKARVYLQKLRDIHQAMAATTDKLGRLQQRAFKVRQFKDKQYENSYREWLTDLEYQKQLMAKYEPPGSQGKSPGEDPK